MAKQHRSKVTKVADLDSVRTVLAVTRSDGKSFEYIVGRRPRRGQFSKYVVRPRTAKTT